MQDWSGKTGGTHGMQRMLVGLIRLTDIRVAYGLMHLWLIWYILIRKTERHGAYVFHRRRGRTKIQAALDVYRSFYHFGQAIIDRFAVYAGEPFEVIVENKERYDTLVSQPEGFIMLFSHVGNSEMCGYFLTRCDKPMHILIFGGESPVVMAHRKAVLERNNIEMIEVLPNQLDHIYRIYEVLQKGDILTIAADRRMGEHIVRCPFMGAEASFPAGPFRICQTVNRPVLLFFVVKEKARTYRVYTEQLDPAKNLPQQFAQHMERIARTHPYEWFNFYDFWG